MTKWLYLCHQKRPVRGPFCPSSHTKKTVYQKMRYTAERPTKMYTVFATVLFIPIPR